MGRRGSRPTIHSILHVVDAIREHGERPFHFMTGGGGEGGTTVGMRRFEVHITSSVTFGDKQLFKILHKFNADRR